MNFGVRGTGPCGGHIRSGYDFEGEVMGRDAWVWNPNIESLPPGLDKSAYQIGHVRIGNASAMSRLARALPASLMAQLRVCFYRAPVEEIKLLKEELDALFDFSCDDKITEQLVHARLFGELRDLCAKAIDLGLPMDFS